MGTVNHEGFTENFMAISMGKMTINASFVGFYTGYISVTVP